MAAIGFMFMGAFSYSSLTPSTPQENTGEFEMPEETFRETGFNLSPNQQAVLSSNNRVVFANVMLNEKSNSSDYRELAEAFNGTAYIAVSTENTTNTETWSSLSSKPGALVIGDRPSESRQFSIKRVDARPEAVREAVCDATTRAMELKDVCY